MKSLESTARCETCGSPLPAGCRPELCPVCALEGALAGDAPAPPCPIALPGFVAGEASSPVRLGDYELIEEVARGGMGVVFKARQLSLRRVVALKMILAGTCSGPLARERFRAEASMAARLQHPNIVSIHEVGEWEGHPYFTMDYVEGNSLSERVRDRPPTPREAALYAQTLARAIDYAHQRGVLHRDLKPSNVLLDSFDQPRITDFGLARPLGEDSDLTLSGQVLGSPSFISPEQAAGRHKELGRATDIYALGAVLYHLLTGRPPFQGTSLTEVLSQVQSADPVPPRRLNAGVPPDLETICLKCLEKDPARRYASAGALADDLARFSRGMPIQARPVRWPGKTRRLVRRHPVVSALIATVTLLLVLVAATSTVAAWRIKQAEGEATDKLREAYLAQARAGRLSGQMGQRLEGLNTLRLAARLKPNPAFRERLRQEAIACLMLTDARPITLHSGDSLPSRSRVRLSPALDLHAVIVPEGHVSVRRTDTAVEVAALHPSGGGSVLGSFSPDGRHLALWRGDRVWEVWDVREARPVLSFPDGGRVVFSPDSRQAAQPGTDGRIRLANLAAGQVVAEWEAGNACEHLAFDPTGQRLALSLDGAGKKTPITIREAATGRWLLQSDPLPRVRMLAWHPEGTLLAAATEEGHALLIEAATGALRQSLEGHEGETIAVAFSSDGSRLATSGSDKTIRLWDTWRGKAMLRLPGTASQLQFSPDDSRLALAREEDRLCLYELEHDREFRILSQPTRPAPPYRIGFSPDGRWLAGTAADHVALFEVQTGRLLGTIPEQACRSAQFHPDGHSLWLGGPSGLTRWTLTIQPGASGTRLRVGPAQRVLPPGNWLQTEFSTTGSHLAVASPDQGEIWMIDTAAPAQVRRLSGHPLVYFVSLSPDGRLVASGPRSGSLVRVAEVSTGRMITDLPVQGPAPIQFSPRGDRISVATQIYASWDTTSWQPVPGLDQSRTNATTRLMAYDRSGDLLVLTDRDQNLHLVTPDTFKTLAQLEPPGHPVLADLALSPDGAHLAAAVPNGQILLWDLRRLRSQLARIGLDWDAPPFPEGQTPKDDDTPGPVTMECVVSVPDFPPRGP